MPGEVGGQGNALRYARAAADAVCEMEGGLPITHSHNIIDFALAARELREKRVADLLSHLEKAHPEGFQYLGDGRGMASARSETGYVAQCWTSSTGLIQTANFDCRNLSEILSEISSEF